MSPTRIETLTGSSSTIHSLSLSFTRSNTTTLSSGQRSCTTIVKCSHGKVGEFSRDGNALVLSFDLKDTKAAGVHGFHEASSISSVSEDQHSRQVHLI